MNLKKSPRERELCEQLYSELTAEGFEVLYDDREESAGVKFTDADLPGLPVRLVVSPRTLREQAVEIKGRREEKGRLVGMAEVGEAVRSILAPGR